MTIISEQAERQLISSVNARRLAQDLRALARIGATSSGGVSRLAYTPLEREAHRLVAKRVAEMGLAVRGDAAGNTIARRPGTQDHLPIIGFGSHLDTVYEGGNFDGVVGVVAALEVIRVFREQEITTQHPLAVMVFAGEEGARFGAPHIGSRALVGTLTLEELRRLRDAEGVTLEEAMREVGFPAEDLPSARWDPQQIACFLELHIEQGRALETTGKAMGIVEAIGAASRMRVRLQGRTDHSGATPMNIRRDALAAAAEIILGVERIAAQEAGRTTVATVGRLRATPGVITAVPGEVEMDVDIRDIDAAMKEQAVTRIQEMMAQVARRREIALSTEVLTDQTPATLPMWIREVTRSVCQDLRLSYRVMANCAGHDARILADMTPAGMIFLPSKDGISHHPAEWSEIADIATATTVLANTILRLDEALLLRSR